MEVACRAFTVELMQPLRTEDWAETFVSPRQSFGALIQFCSTMLRVYVETDAYGVHDVVAGRVVGRDWVACLRATCGKIRSFGRAMRLASGDLGRDEQWRARS